MKNSYRYFLDAVQLASRHRPEIIVIGTNGTSLLSITSYHFHQSSLIESPRIGSSTEIGEPDHAIPLLLSPFPCSRVSRETLVEQLEASMERGWTVMRRPRDGSELLILGTVRIPAIRGDYQVGWYAPRRMWNPFFPLRSAILSSL